MPQPTASDVHVNAPLTQISIAFLQSADQFIADKVFPMVPVTHQSDRYYEYLRGNWFRSSAQSRAPGTESAGGGWKMKTDSSYFADVKAVHKDVDDQIRANQDSVIDMDRDATRWVTQQLLLKRDIDWAESFFKTGAWGSDITVPAKWSSALSTPIEDIRTQYYEILKSTGYKPNTLVLGAEVHRALVDHPSFVDRIKFTQRGVVDTEIMASVLGLDRVLVASAVQNSAAEGALTDSYDFILGKSALLTYAAPSPSLMEASGGYIFSWSGPFGSVSGTRIKRFRMDPLSADRVEGEMAYDMKQVSPDLGKFFFEAVA
jgi:hypothetical protein